jgi:hypothetical protein
MGTKKIKADPTKTLMDDAKKYEKRIKEKLSVRVKDIGTDSIPLIKEIGEAYMKAFRKVNGTAFAVQIPRDVLAYLYTYVVNNNISGAAVGLANYNKAELKAARVKDPNFKDTKENQNSLMIGVWDDHTQKIMPMKVFFNELSKDGIEFYDDWNQEWP